MNYTENYHLPQWDETDRIMRADFNQMCGDIEGGLTTVRDMAETHLSGLDRGLFRLAYNHLHALRGRDPQPPQLGAFYHDPYKDPVPNVRPMEGSLYMSLSDGTESPTAAGFFASVETVSSHTMVAGDPNASVAQVYRFTCPVSGWITQLFLVENLTHTTAKPSYLLKLKNLNTGVVECAKRIDTSRKTSSMGFVQMMLPFYAKIPYEMTLELEEPVAGGTVEIRMNTEGNNVLFFNTHPGCTLTRTLDDFEGSQGGLVLVRCRPNGAGGSVTLTWNGVVYQPTATRMQPVEGELPIHELLYIRNEPLPAKNELSVAVQCNVDGVMNFYDWGAMLF